MLKIPWTAGRLNKSTIEELEEHVRLSVLCEKRISRYVGHVVRRNEELYLVRYLFQEGEEEFPPTVKARMGSVALAAEKAKDRDSTIVTTITIDDDVDDWTMEKLD